MNNIEENKEKKIVLVVEDDELLMKAIIIKLEHAGYIVIPCATAEQGLEALKKKIPDFIWLDMLLPGMSGVDFLQQMREKDEWHNIPVMIVTVSMSPERMKRALELNVIDVAMKSDHELKDIVDQVSSYFESCSGEC